jgi:micrococcal nuclease
VFCVLLVIAGTFGLGSCVHAETPVIEAAPPTSAAADPSQTPILGPDIRGPLASNASVVYVTDGDTVILRVGNVKEHTRLIGIDTPETKKPNTAVECFGKRASAAMASLLPVGTAVHIERDVEERDRYGRLLAYIFRSADGLFVNQEMVRTGMAVPLSIAPNVTYADRFAEAGVAARVHNVGLWSACDSGHEPTAANSAGQ